MGKRASSSGDQISSRWKRAQRRKAPDDAPSHTSCTSQAAQIQSHFPRLKRPRKRKTTEDAPGLRSCTTGDSQIQILPRRIEKSKSITCNQRPFSAAAQVSRSSYSSVCWGAKRLRTALARRDWSDLDEGPAGLIADLVLANDVADYIRFRAVCRPWRRCCDDPRGLAVLEDRRLHPRRWIMLLEKIERLPLPAVAAPHSVRRRFLNVSSGQCVQVDVPELRDHDVLQSTTEGLLFLMGTTSRALRLLNPLTRQVAELPPLTAGMEVGNFSPANAGLVDDGHRTVLLHFNIDADNMILAFAKPGDERWVQVKITESLKPTMSFAGRFYGVANDAIMMVDTTTTTSEGGEDLQPTPRLVVAAKLATPIRRMTDTAHLVESGGELMLVHGALRRISSADDAYRTKYKLYRVNLAKGKATPASARGHAIFIGCNRALSVQPQVFPSLSANAVYVGLDFDERGAYHLRDGSTESFNHGSWSDMTHPWTIADCLSTYVSG